MHDIFKCDYCRKALEDSLAEQPKADIAAILRAFATAAAESLDAKTEAEIVASPDLRRDAEWLLDARAALAEEEPRGTDDA
ncbi:MAG: hypothetical protein JNJ76_09450 [Candidatus Competibacter sp.]|nr:hypothetical protein [Candidatus Competibacter sp.]